MKSDSDKTITLYMYPVSIQEFKFKQVSIFPPQHRMEKKILNLHM